MRLASSPAARLFVAGLLTALTAPFLAVTYASAATPPAPGNFTGYGFDACVAPSQKVMDAWNLHSPFSAIGIYISGNSRYCSDKDQPNLSKEWVAKNAANGWRFMPIHVGYQSPCFKNNPQSKVQKKHMSSDPVKARVQGQSDAAETIAALVKLGFGDGSYSYLDLEAAPHSTSCDNAELAFADGWTDYLHDNGYKSGVYSSGSAAIKLIDSARKAKRKDFTLPDQMWNAWTNQKADTDGGSYLSADGWTNHQRIHQYDNGLNLTYGGQKLNIDKDYLDVGKGSVASKESLPCEVKFSFSSYPRLTSGSAGAAVSALQCLLTQQGFATDVSGVFGSSTAKAIDGFRAKLGWGKTGHTTQPTWTALLAAGSKPHVLKQGSVGEAVWRLQRALVAAGASVSINGKYDSKTGTAVKAYRAANGLSGEPYAEATFWSRLQSGKPA